VSGQAITQGLISAELQKVEAELAERDQAIELQARKIRFFMARLAEGHNRECIMDEFVTRCTDWQDFEDF
jgi:hypothetical protein